MKKRCKSGRGVEVVCRLMQNVAFEGRRLAVIPALAKARDERRPRFWWERILRAESPPHFAVLAGDMRPGFQPFILIHSYPWALPKAGMRPGLWPSNAAFWRKRLLSNTLQIVEGEGDAAIRKEVCGGARASSPFSPASCRGVGRVDCENGTFLARAVQVCPARCRTLRARSPRSPATVFLDTYASPCYSAFLPLLQSFADFFSITPKTNL